MKKNGFNVYLALVLMFVGFIFLRSGYGKVTGGEFVEGLGKTLGFFASKNPNPFVQSFLINTAIPNASIFGMLTMWGELLIGLGILISLGYYLVRRSFSKITLIVLGLSLLGAGFLNAVFWLAAGWTSPSTDSLNLLMLVIAVTGLIFTLKQYRDLA